jgi:CDP-glucose 4,6-dehydratase
MKNQFPNSFWPMRRVFITGATGFLGGWLASELIRQGAHVVALVRDHVPQSRFVAEGWHEQATVISGSLLDLPLLSRAISEYEIDCVFHLAAQAIVGVANKNPVGTLETNVAGTWNLLEACRVGKAKQVIIASSDKAYGRQTELPYSERHAMQGTHPYDVSKSCADLIARMYAASYGLPVCITRCANLYGGGDLNFNRLIPGVVRACLTDQPFVIRSDGQFIRDYLYVEDAVRAYLRLAELMAHESELQGEAFNVSAGVRATAIDVVQTVLEALGRHDLSVQILNQASNEIREQYLDATKFREATGWAPHHSLQTGLDRTIEWYSKRQPWAPSDSALMGATA